MIKQERLYKDMAWIWPTMSPPAEYIEEAEFLTNLIKSYMTYSPKTILHLGCGGGHIDMTLKKHFEITGVDISKNMLDLAKKLNPDNSYVRGDMRNIRLEEKFDVVLLYDGINYMLSERDLKAAFETAHANLKDGGIVLTVVEETPSSFQQNKTHVSHRTGENIELTYIEHWYDPDPDDSTYETTFVYLIRKNKKLTTEFDLHICGIFEVEVWERLLKEVGFRPKQDTFTHSTFAPGEEYPILIGFKK
ncbi:MAG: class I SAM-dependent methyltransferase [Candidatus Zixiibacteriota bacterium]|nr:MAG: class I SAM-dependent methyltransferase [candidate division Zixibacteria bacterium]